MKIKLIKNSEKMPRKENLTHPCKCSKTSKCKLVCPCERLKIPCTSECNCSETTCQSKKEGKINQQNKNAIDLNSVVSEAVMVIDIQQEMNKRFSEFEANMNKKLNNELENVNNQIDSVTTQINTVNTQINSMNHQMTTFGENMFSFVYAAIQKSIGDGFTNLKIEPHQLPNYLQPASFNNYNNDDIFSLEEDCFNLLEKEANQMAIDLPNSRLLAIEMPISTFSPNSDQINNISINPPPSSSNSDYQENSIDQIEQPPMNSNTSHQNLINTERSSNNPDSPNSVFHIFDLK